MKIPEGHQTVMPYLILKDAKAFKKFIEKVFHAEEIAIHSREDKSVMHAEAYIGGTTIMYAGSNETWLPQPAGLFIYVEDVDTAFKKALEHGALAVLEPQDKDYGRSCGVKDPCGNTWWMTQV